MTVRCGGSVYLFLGAISVAGAGALVAQTTTPTPTEAPHPVTFTVTTVRGDSEAEVSKADVGLLVANERTPVEGWAKDPNLALAILIDESIGRGAVSQWDHLRQFIRAQPATTLVLVGYLRNNVTTVAQDFTTDHEAAASAIRIPTGATGPFSPYLAMSNLLRRWPNTGQRRSILLVSSGVDTFRGQRSAVIFPDVDPLIQRAQAQNTNIWAVFYPSAAHRSRRFNTAWTGQNNLSRLADATGGEFYALGTGVPVSLRPHFDEIAGHLGSQYLLTFTAAREEQRGRHVGVDVMTELPDVEFLYPSEVSLAATP